MQWPLFLMYLFRKLLHVVLNSIFLCLLLNRFINYDCALNSVVIHSIYTVRVEYNNESLLEHQKRVIIDRRSLLRGHTWYKIKNGTPKWLLLLAGGRFSDVVINLGLTVTKTKHPYKNQCRCYWNFRFRLNNLSRSLSSLEGTNTLTGIPLKSKDKLSD